MNTFRALAAAALLVLAPLPSRARQGAAAPAAPATTPNSAPRGTLVIAGGGKLPEAVYAAFAEGCGGKGAKVAVLPAASGEPRESAQAMVDRLSKLGLKAVVVDPRHRGEADAAAWEDVKGCTGFWFTGGDQKRIHDKIVGTRLHRLILDAYRGGAAVGGTSAGAAAMSAVMIEGADDVSSAAPKTYRTLPGLGLVPQAILDQHFLKRARHNRLLSLAAEHPDLLGVGVDEGAAIVVKDGRFQVLGGSVLVLDPAASRVLGATLRDLRVHLLGPGQGLDLATRKPLP
jgi:cyanophycinase